jgi:hypothetical protein
LRNQTALATKIPDEAAFAERLRPFRRGSGDAAPLLFGPDDQGDVDVSLLEANLKLTPLARIEACQRAMEQVSQLQEAMKAARHA